MTSSRVMVQGTRGLVGAIIAGCASALVFAFALAHMETPILFMTIYLTSLPLFLVGMSTGAVGALVAAISGAAGLFFAMPMDVGDMYTVIFALPSLIIVSLALRHRTGIDQRIYWYPEGNILTAITLYPCAIFLLLYGMTASHQGGLLELTQTTFQQAFEQFSKQLPANQVMAMHDVLPLAANIAPSIVGWAWVLVTLVTLIVAQKVLEKFKHNIREPFALLDVHLPQWLVFALATTGLMGFLAPAPFDYIGKNLTIILGIPLVIIGIAVVHVWASRFKERTYILAAFYVLISVLFWLTPLVAMLGVLDQWFHLRAHWQKPRLSL